MNATSASPPGWLVSLLDLVYPSLCSGCGSYTESDAGVCDMCAKRIDHYELPFCLGCLQPLATWPECLQCQDHTLPLFALGNYVDPLKQVIAEFKFRGVRRPIASLCRDLVARFEVKLAAVQADCLVPIPLHPSRQYDRGYNQAEVIAQHLEIMAGIPVDTSRLLRVAKRKPQQRLKAHQRGANIRGAYAADDTQPPARIVLVDDIVTSGETVKEAGRVLKQGGSVVVGVVALAHGA